MGDILQNVERDKRQKWNEKYEKYLEQTWNRDNFTRRIRELKRDIDSIEGFITDIQESRREITGVPENKTPDDMSENDFGEIEGSEFDRIIQDFGEEDFEYLKSKNVLGENPTLGSIDDKRDELQRLRKKENEWKTLQFELAHLGMEKLDSVAKNFKKEFKSGQVAKDFEKHAQQLVKSEVEKAKAEIKQEMSDDVAELEQAINSARNETKNAWAFVDKFGEVFTEWLEKNKVGEIQASEEEFKEIAEQAVEEGLNQLTTKKGTIDLSGEQLRREEDRKEKEEARDAATSSYNLAAYQLEGKDLEDQHETLQVMAENEDLLEMKTDDIVDLVDVDRETLTLDILDSIEDEYGTRFGID